MHVLSVSGWGPRLFKPIKHKEVKDKFSSTLRKLSQLHRNMSIIISLKLAAFSLLVRAHAGYISLIIDGVTCRPWSALYPLLGHPQFPWVLQGLL